MCPDKTSSIPAEKNIRVLCVTDQIELKKLIRKNLGKVFDLTLASSGEKGIGMVAEKKPDLVLMDMCMHRLSGIDTARMIKQASPSTPIVMMTMYQCDSSPTGI